jgi:DNA invertase Pin-like site-specific DNA recombinase
MISLEMAKKPVVISYLRFSRPEQMRGDTVRRQVEKSEAWAKERGLTLDSSIRDEGVSAFRGTNATEGALSRLLELVRAGRIPKTSILLVESLDRLSRNEMTEAMQLFLSIVSKGIKIVTLADGYEYTRESINQNFGNLMYSLMVLSRSHEESAVKSMRVAAAWAKKREQARKKKTLMTVRLPSWLQIGDNGKPVLNPERATVVREVYRLTAEGHGIVAIQGRLNAKYRGVRARYISRTHIHDMLTSRAVLGEFQPSKMVMVNGRQVRMPEGDPIPGYFPAVVSQELYYKAQASRRTRQRTGGPNTKYVNLLAGKLYAADGSRMIIQSKRQRVYVSSDAVNAAPGAVPFRSIPVRCMEVATVVRLAEPSMHQNVQVNDETDDKIESLLEETGQVERQIDGATKQALAGKMSPSVVALLNSLDKKKAELQQQVETVKVEQASRRGTDRSILGQMMTQLDNLMDGKLSLEDRTRLKNALAQYVERIDCKVTKHGRWFSVRAKAKLLDGQTIAYHVICRTLKSDEQWEVYLKEDIGYYGIRNDMGEVKAAWFHARPTAVPAQLDKV